MNTYGISTVGSVLGLCLMKFHLLLLHDGLDLFVFLADDFKQIFSQNLGTLYLTFVRTSEKWSERV